MLIVALLLSGCQAAAQIAEGSFITTTNRPPLTHVAEYNAAVLRENR